MRRQLTATPRRLLGTILLFLVIALPGAVRADGPIVVQIPSQRPSGIAVNDQIWVTYYPAVPASGPAPAIVLLHPIGESTGDLSDRYMHFLAGQFARRGIACALMTLPYHGQRLPPHTSPIEHFIEPNVPHVVQAIGQGASDVSTVATWLTRRPDVDPRRLGVVGISLGAIVGHLAMGQDPRLNAGVMLEGGGDLPTLYRDSLEVKLHGHYTASVLNPAALAQLQTVDPSYYAAFNQPRHVLMIEAARDLYVPPHNAIFLWDALGHPPIQWVDTNHFAFLLSGDSLARTATAYLTRVWSGRAEDTAGLPRYSAPTLKFGWLIEFDGNITPAAHWQVHSFATGPHHLSALFFDVGESGRGPFAALGTALDPYIDAGIAYRVNGRPTVPYASIHFVF